MRICLKVVALGAVVASLAAAIPVEKRDAATDKIINTGLIKSISINQMSMDFTPANPWTPITSSNSVVATMLALPGISLPIDNIRQHIILVDNNVQIGNIETPWSSAKVSGSTLTTSFPSTTLSVFNDAHAAFSSFISALSTKASHPVTLQGAVDAQLNLGVFGRMTIPGIGFKTTVVFDGLNNLSQMKFLYLIDTNFDTPNFIYMTTIINIINPSKLSLKLGDVSFSTATAGGYVGVSSIKNLNLIPGNNYVLSSTGLDLSYPAAVDFLTNLGNADGVLSLTGFAKSSANVALNAGLAAVKSPLVVPKNFEGAIMSQAPYKNWSLKTLPSTNSDFLVEITATFQSPYYGFPIQMVSASDEGQDNFATVGSIPSGSGINRLFTFLNNLTFSVSGSGSVTVAFKVALTGPFDASSKAAWQDLVNYGTANKYIPINLSSMIAKIIVNNDGINRFVDWSSFAAGLEDIKLAVGPDFASIMKAFP
ncbi:hypothetical protein BGZ70_004421 [Mortierella alpina]|uniref:Uncharacterized protein n=1 Tax=Mortierella alpina TaxID=64518 RepID=A0A9P6M4N9_MORAP|nr:hypothetical protein BGZ70_004421 [Mortierella alpina]